jgi:thioredoxin-like negative regulator of GroEL
MSIQLHTIAKKYSQHLSVIKYDVESKNTKSLKVEMLLQGVHVRGLPTLLLYNNGVPVATHSGAITEQDLYGWLDNNLATISETKSVSKKEVEERDAVNEVPTSGKRGFVSFVDRYTL